MRGLSPEQVRLLDRRAVEEFLIPSLILMENAGRGAADQLCRLGIEGPVVVCCGRGNNAGDGLVMARHLDLRGHRVEILHWTPPGGWKGDAATQYEIILRAQIACRQLPDAKPATMQAALDGANWIVDALLGTGSIGNPRSPYAEAIAAMNGAAAKRLALDLPSGLDGTTGVPSEPTFQADHTCTFVAPKSGMLKPTARDYVGTLHVHDIGAPRRLIDQFLGT